MQNSETLLYSYYTIPYTVRHDSETATASCEVATLFWWHIDTKSRILTAKGGNGYDFWRKNTKTEKRIRTIAGRTFLSVRSFPSGNQQVGARQWLSYVSLETAEGFLCYQKAKVTKIGIAVGLYIGSLALPLWNPELGILIFIVLMIAATVLLFSVKLNDNPYRRLWKEPLLFDKNTKAKLTSAYTDWRKRANLCILTGITFIAAGILFFPLIIPASYEFLDTLVIGCGILLAALGAFLCIAAGGIMRAYRLLIMNETYQEKKKVRI